jgi:BASS family bile acid:Na+ symporter
MNKKKLLFQVFLAIAALLLVLTVITWVFDQQQYSGPLLTFFFIFLAASFHGFKNLKKFAYTVWIFAAVTISMNYPSYFRELGGVNLQILIVPLLQIIMFGMGSQLSVKNFADVIKMPKGVGVGVVSQFTIMPIVGFTVATIFGFPAEIAAGIILVGSSPSGLASNVMTFIAKANLALSVTLTTVATLLAPIMTPFLMKTLAGRFVPIDFWDMMLTIVNIVILPIIAGLIFNTIGYVKEKRRNIFLQIMIFVLIIVLKNFINFQTTDVALEAQMGTLLQDVLLFQALPIAAALVLRRLAGGNRAWLDRAMSLISMVGIGIIITIITAAGRDSLIEIGLALVLACLIHNILGYLLGYWGCRLIRMKEHDARAVALEVGMQNGGLASGIALEMGKVATVGLAPAVFGPMMNVTGSSLANIWRSKPLKDEKADESTQQTSEVPNK